MSSPLPIAWTIAGSDSGGGAGIQADLHTFRDFGVHGCSAITALTAQNSRTVTDVAVTPPANLRAQLQALADDLPAAALKTGMLGDASVVALVAEYLERFQGWVVCDPVMVSTTGASLLSDEGRGALDRLFAQVDLLTPNHLEAEALLGRPLASAEAIEQAAADLLARGVGAVLIKGGHHAWLEGASADYFSDGRQSFWLLGERVPSEHTHGSGCTLSAAIAACLARGCELPDALVLAKMYVTQGIRGACQLGAGPGPVAHLGFPRELRDLPRVVMDRAHARRDARFPDCGDLRLGLYPVVDSAEWIERLLALGVLTLQLRVKHLAGEALDAEIARAVAAGRQHGARLFINDHWQLAIKHGAYGVHLGQEDLDDADLAAIAAAGLRLGTSNHSWWELARSHAIQPSYLALGPIYETATKQMRFAEQGLAQLRQWVELFGRDYPLVAIGGIGLARAPGVAATGVGSIAVVRAITEAADPAVAVQALGACLR